MSQKVDPQSIDNALLSVFAKKHIESHPNKIKYSAEDEKSGFITKVAFDVYKVDNDPYENLWRLESMADGPYLIRTDIPTPGVESKGDWSVTSDASRENLTLSYKNVPIARFSSIEYGFDKSDIMAFKSALIEQAQNDSSFLKNVLDTQPVAKKEALTKSFPEFQELYKRN